MIIFQGMIVNILWVKTVLQHVLPANSSYDEKLRKIGRLLVKMFEEGLIEKSENGKRWHITENGEKELNS